MGLPSVNSAMELTALNLNLKCPSVSVMFISKFLTVIFSGGEVDQELLHTITHCTSL